MKIQTSLRVDDKFYKESKEIFSELGMSFAEGVNLFLAKVAMEKKISFELSVKQNNKKRKWKEENKKAIEFYNKTTLEDGLILENSRMF